MKFLLFCTRYIYGSVLFLILAVIVAACANIVSPTGGPRDTTPPKMLSAVPPDQSINFSSKKVVINFDEFIQLRDLHSKLMVSPPLKEFPDIKVRNRSLHIEFKEELQENTTYNMYFGDAIADITETNQMRDFSYVFSTGNYLDSMQLRGSLKMASTAEPEKDVLVMLYPADSHDSLPLIGRPTYVTKTNESGQFLFRNLGNATYRLFALKDANSNYIYDLPNELIGFITEPVHPYHHPKPDTTSTDSMIFTPPEPLEVLLFDEEDSVQRIMRAGISELNRFLIAFRYPVKDVEVEILNADTAISKVIKDINQSNDTLVLWLKNFDTDSLEAVIYDASQLIDTVKGGIEYRTRRGVPGFADMTSLKLNTNITNLSLSFFDTLKLFSKRPLENFDHSLFILTTEKDSIIDSLEIKADMIARSGLRSLDFAYNWLEGQKYSLMILPSAVSDIYGLENDTITIDFTTSTPENYGTIKLEIKLPEDGQQYILQLIQGDKLVVSSFLLQTNTNIEINNIKPGKYQIKCIRDNNRNGRWDSGNYLRKIQPEKTFIPHKDLQINANWEVELEINISEL